MMLAAAALVAGLLQQIEEASHAEPPVFQVETLLGTARLLAGEDHAGERRGMIQAAVRAMAAVRDEESRQLFLTEAAFLLAPQDRAEARRLCGEARLPGAIKCWLVIDPLAGLRLASYPKDYSEAETQFRMAASQVLAEQDSKRAAEMLEKLEKQQREAPVVKPKLPGASPAIKAKMDRADRDDVADVEKSRLLREVLEESGSIEDVTDRMMHQAVITAWFAANREEGTATLAAAMLHETFAAACRCEDGQCDSVAGRADCSENIDTFVEYLAENQIDPAVLRIRHPSLAARVLVHQLKEMLK